MMPEQAKYVREEERKLRFYDDERLAERAVLAAIRAAEAEHPLGAPKPFQRAKVRDRSLTPHALSHCNVRLATCAAKLTYPAHQHACRWTARVCHVPNAPSECPRPPMSSTASQCARATGRRALLRRSASRCHWAFVWAALTSPSSALGVDAARKTIGCRRTRSP